MLRKPKLRDLLDQHFSSNELQNLCYDLAIEYENLAGSTRKAKARELIDFCERRGRLNELVNHCCDLRPNVDWTEFITVENNTTASQEGQTEKALSKPYDNSTEKACAGGASPNLNEINPQLKSIPSRVRLPSVLVIGHRFDTDIQGNIQYVLWDEDEPNLTEYDIVILDLTLERKPLLPLYRPSVWKSPEFNKLDYLTWTHTRNRIEKLVLSGGSIIVVVDSNSVYHIDRPARLMNDRSQKLLPFVIYGEQTPIGTSIKLIDSRFESYFQNFGGWNFTLNRDFNLEFECNTSYKVQKGIPIAMNKVNEMLAVSVEVESSNLEDSGWIHVLPKPLRKTSFDAVRSLVSNIDNFIQ